MINILSKFYIWHSIIVAIIICGCAGTANKHWMQDNADIITGKKLTQITLPGSHIANAYNIKLESLVVCRGEVDSTSDNASAVVRFIASSSVTPTPILNYLNTQKQDISAQLNSGVRYLDIKICLQDANFYTANYFLTESLDMFLSKIKLFLKKNKQEVLIIDLDNNLFSEYGSLSFLSINGLHNAIQQQLGSYLLPALNYQQQTIGDIWKTGHRILLLSSNAQMLRFYDVINRDQFVEAVQQTGYATIQKLTLLRQALTASPQTADKLHILPLYSIFLPINNDIALLNPKLYNDQLLLSYLQSISLDVPLNILVANDELLAKLSEFAITRNQKIAKQTHK